MAIQSTFTCNPQIPFYTIIGYGKAGGIHAKLLPNSGIIDIAQKAIEKAKQEGKRTFKSIAEAYTNIDPASNIFNICVPTDMHLTVLKEIAILNPKARVITEKPVCDGKEILELLQLLKLNPSLMLCINENQRSSLTTIRLVYYVKQYFKETTSIAIEKTKNRIPDFIEEGRFVDPLGVWGYEGPHILTIFKTLTKLLKISYIMKDLNVSFTSLNQPKIDETKVKQGGSEATFITDEGIKVTFYTSMMGKVKFAFHANQELEIIDVKKNYRVCAITGKDQQGKKGTLVAFYDKVEGLKPLESEIYYFDENNNPKKVEGPIEDNTMKKNLEQCSEYLMGVTKENPSPVEDAVEIVQTIMKFNELEKSNL